MIPIISIALNAEVTNTKHLVIKSLGYPTKSNFSAENSGFKVVTWKRTTDYRRSKTRKMRYRSNKTNT